MTSGGIQTSLPDVSTSNPPKENFENEKESIDPIDPMDRILNGAENILFQVNELIKLAEEKKKTEVTQKRRPGRPRKTDPPVVKKRSPRNERNSNHRYDSDENIYRKPRGKHQEDSEESDEEVFDYSEIAYTRPSRKKRTLSKYVEPDENIEYEADSWTTEMEEEIDGFKLTLSTDIDQPWKIIVRDALRAFDHEPAEMDKILDWVNKNSFKAGTVPAQSVKACIKSTVNVASNWIKDDEGRLISFKEPLKQENSELEPEYEPEQSLPDQPQPSTTQA